MPEPSSTTTILLVTHAEIGAVLLRNAKNILSDIHCQCHCVNVELDQDPDSTFTQARQLLCDSERALILTDLYGSTPANIACRLGTECDVPAAVISGVNLPMLMRAITNNRLPIDQLADKVAEGGQRSIIVESGCSN